MSLINKVAGELAGMFVGDARLAVTVIAVVAATAAICASGLPPLLGGAMLVGGSLCVLLDSVRRVARNR